MQRVFQWPALVIMIILPTGPAFCGTSLCESFQLSVTIPQHVMANNNNLEAVPLLKNMHQIIQTQTVIRNNRTISLTSIVVP